MAKILPSLIEKLKYLPDSPGIYKMLNAAGTVIYVGKALSLKHRVSSYFTPRPDIIDSYQQKIVSMVAQITDFEYIITATEEEAFLLEANLIKEYKPRYNVSWKDDKRYPFFKITLNEPFPRLLVEREPVKDGSKYFGPYADTSIIRRTMRTVEWLLPVRTCSRNIPAGAPVYKKACLNYQLGKCSAPCIGKISVEEYGSIIKQLIQLLSGKNKEIIAYLKAEMTVAGNELNFEKAAKIRDKLIMFDKLQKSQSVFFFDEEDRDVIALYQEDKITAVAVLKILGGKLLNQEYFLMENAKDTPSEEIIATFINQYYVDKLDSLPLNIIVSEKPADFESLNKLLKNKLIIPQRGEHFQLLNIARKNVFEYIENIKLRHMRKTARTVFPIQELKEKLQLKKLPRKIACVDISTIQGTDTVSSLVYFENGKALKKNYRHFIIKTVNGQDDFSSVKETLLRYLTKVSDEDKPDLIMIDGGKGQLSSAYAILKDYPEITLISLAKRVEEIFTPQSSEPIFLPRSSSALRLLVNIRDEAHRFAITFHRKKRSDRTLTSELDLIPGIGTNTKFLLLKHFGSVENIKYSSLEELTAIKGIGNKTASDILFFLTKVK